MTELRIVSDAGFKALGQLAADEPGLFVQPDSETLRARMEAAVCNEGGPDALPYSEAPFPMQASLDELNLLNESGPSSDAILSLVLHRAVGELSPAYAASPKLWASINCFALSNYVPVRWNSSNLSESASTNFVDRHWLKYSGAEGRKWNAAARLWWLGEMASRAAEHSQHSYNDLLEAMAGNVQFYHQIHDRSFLSSNPQLVAALYDVFLDGNQHLNATSYASDLMKALNLRAATLSFDFLDYRELRQVVEEAKPPKGS